MRRSLLASVAARSKPGIGRTDKLSDERYCNHTHPRIHSATATHRRAGALLIGMLTASSSTLVAADSLELSTHRAFRFSRLAAQERERVRERRVLDDALRVLTPGQEYAHATTHCICRPRFMQAELRQHHSKR